jgi:hypothetical protein
MSPPETWETTEALLTLEAYVRGAVSLHELIDWAEHLEARSSHSPWLRSVAADLANPLLCREQAVALVREHLRSRPALDN